MVEVELGDEDDTMGGAQIVPEQAAVQLANPPSAADNKQELEMVKINSPFICSQILTFYSTDEMNCTESCRCNLTSLKGEGPLSLYIL